MNRLVFSHPPFWPIRLTWSIEGGAQCHAIGWYCWTKCGSPQTNPGRAADGGERSTFLHSFHLPPTQVQDKDLLVSPQTCSTPECTAGSAAACSLPQCELCRFHTVLLCLNLKPATARQCLTEADLTALRRAWLERKNQFATTRIFPPPVSREGELLNDLEGSNRKMAAWYKGKCLMDVSWCG